MAITQYLNCILYSYTMYLYTIPQYVICLWFMHQDTSRIAAPNAMQMIKIELRDMKPVSWLRQPYKPQGLFRKQFKFCKF